jgi:hypothetical protein
VETIAVRMRYRAGRVRVEAPSACILCGTCSPPRTDVAFPTLSLAAVRSRSSTRFRLFLMLSLPLVTPQKQQAAGSCRSQNTGTLTTP